MDFFEKTGIVALGSRLRLLTARFTEDAIQTYALYGPDFNPKWFPVFTTLNTGKAMIITEIATAIKHSQPSVTKIIKEMKAAGLVEDVVSGDKRRSSVQLSEKGKETAARIAIQSADVEAAIANMINKANYNLWEAINEWEQLLDEKSLYKRVTEQKKIRESKDVQVVEYNSSYQKAFKQLNKEWISAYFEMEESDYKALDNPQGYILDKGGKIFVALYNNEPVGVCALIKMDNPDYDFEMAKMAVSPKAQGKSIGWLLGNAVISAAKEAGASKIYLESNTILKPAINLYYKLGFKKVTGLATPYKRCNIQMELDLN